jgi:TolA-binding protein
MSTKLEKVTSDIEKTEKKITEMQDQLRELYDKKTELENVEIVNTIRAMVLDKESILDFLKTMKPAQAKSVKTATNHAPEKEDLNENE